MNRTSQISVRKWIFEHPFNQISKPTSSFSLNSFTTDSTQRAADTAAPSPKPGIPSSIISNIHRFLHPTLSNASTQLSARQNLRKYSGGSGGELDQNKEVDTINLKFAEAREEIEMAMESKETVYFNEEAECARAAVKEVLDLFEGLLAKVSESEKAALRRSMGLKIEQLKAELLQLDE
ncbi:embryogenesis-like protein [Humulus lupulus]|uniref:embryogenesis-like protein n=1 Tax=Humulus lupulus TaxID=3486 RepID=UPI002B40610B|nr:embryogenesis-like protein [Humulus lupulus]